MRTHFESFKVQIDQIEEDIKSKQIALDYLDSEYNGMSPAGATPPPAFGGTSDDGRRRTRGPSPRLRSERARWSARGRSRCRRLARREDGARFL